mmetsp:Transcript_5731/g.11740  ORF Transcript_5731/g.11740 Transcript_5731/m.11740 type:complete len:101 (-) Transcript_5731:273-575(-)|eukprot:CAMPEP_0171522972 /NCGR_PEP_ID=MMETSP0959-20130129/8114_1 /TAXON_ID=87120 /ORGANISM="Aurantiochytrium limacinum, Strain ATCCMYA-1381" /LENGTH=100 /DNA_ID=CAMNT_0012063303 /DNA_START=299 /DNA_END=601 /DNA_ORIENTATION=+
MEGGGGRLARSLRVRDLPETASDGLLRALFVPFGEISEVKLGLRGRQCTGDAIVTMSEAEDADSARDNLHNSEVFGKVIRVSEASEQDFSELGIAPASAQ